MYVHPPLNPKTKVFPSEHGDQMAPVVLTSRLVRPMRHRTFSTSYQVMRVCGNYSGIDTCNLNAVGRFDVTSSILNDNENLALKYRQDLREHLESLVKRRILSRPVADQMLESAKNEIDMDLNSSLYGSTSFTFQDAIELHRSLSQPHIATDMVLEEIQHSLIRTTRGIGNNANSRELRNHPFTPSWPSYLFRVHPCNSFGAVPRMLDFLEYGEDIDGGIVWMIASLCSLFPTLWKLIDERVRSRHEWYGWFLTFVSDYHVIPHINQMKKHKPYPYLYTDHSQVGKEKYFKELIRSMVESLSNGTNDTFFAKIGELCERINPDKIISVRLNQRYRSPQRCVDRWNQIDDDESVPSTGRRRVGQIPRFKKNAQFLMFHRDFGTVQGSDDRIPETIEIKTNQEYFQVYKLCYLSMLDFDPTAANVPWNVRACCRNEEERFTEWWYCNRWQHPYEARLYHLEGPEVASGPRNLRTNTRTTCYAMDEEQRLPMTILNEWEFAVYVNTFEAFKSIREQYMHSFDGQEKVSE